MKQPGQDQEGRKDLSKNVSKRRATKKKCGHVSCTGGSSHEKAEEERGGQGFSEIS